MKYIILAFLLASTGMNTRASILDQIAHSPLFKASPLMLAAITSGTLALGPLAFLTKETASAIHHTFTSDKPNYVDYVAPVLFVGSVTLIPVATINLFLSYLF